MTTGKLLSLRLGSRTGGRNGPPLLLWGPACVVAAAMALPLVYLLLRALGAGGDTWDLLFRSRTLETLGRTCSLLITVTTGSVVLALPLAWLTERTDLPFRRAWEVINTLPLVVPSYIGGFLVVVTLGPKGMLQDLLEALFGVERLPDIYGLPGATLTLVLLSFPYVLLPLRAAMRQLDHGLDETARSLGYGGWTIFFKVTLPLLRPALLSGALLVALYTLSDFGAVSLLDYETFTRAIFIQYESAFDRNLAAGLCLALLVLAVLLLMGESLARGGGRYDRSSGRVSAKPLRVPLGRWRWPALAYCGLVCIFSLVIPLGVLVYWLVRGIDSGESLSPLWSAGWRSLYVSALAMAVAAVAALPVAILAVRYPGRATRLLERASYVGFALPAIAVALGLVFFGAGYATPLYQTLPLLVLAYVVLYLPASVGATRTSMLQVSPRVEEAARNLGANSLRRLLTVTVPLVGPGILAGAALVFLLTMKELPATLILAPPGFQTLATSVWSAASEAFFAQAAMAGLLLVAVSALPMVLLFLRQQR